MPHASAGLDSNSQAAWLTTCGCCAGVMLLRREGKFYVLPEEPDYVHAAASSSSPTGAAAGGPGGPNSFLPGGSGQLLLRHSEQEQFTAAQLNTLKAQLEALLPASSSVDSDDEGHPGGAGLPGPAA